MEYNSLSKCLIVRLPRHHEIVHALTSAFVKNMGPEKWKTIHNGARLTSHSKMEL